MKSNFGRIYFRELRSHQRLENILDGSLMNNMRIAADFNCSLKQIAGCEMISYRCGLCIVEANEGETSE